MIFSLKNSMRYLTIIERESRMCQNVGRFATAVEFDPCIIPAVHELIREPEKTTSCHTNKRSENAIRIIWSPGFILHSVVCPLVSNF